MIETEDKPKPTPAQIINEKMKNRRYCKLGNHFDSQRAFYQDRFGHWANSCRPCRAKHKNPHKARPNPTLDMVVPGPPKDVKEEVDWRKTLIAIFLEYGAIGSINCIPIGIILGRARVLLNDDSLETHNIRSAIQRSCPAAKQYKSKRGVHGFIVKGRSDGTYALAKDWEKIEQEYRRKKKRSGSPKTPSPDAVSEQTTQSSDSPDTSAR